MFYPKKACGNCVYIKSTEFNKEKERYDWYICGNAYIVCKIGKGEDQCLEFYIHDLIRKVNYKEIEYQAALMFHEYKSAQELKSVGP